MKNCGTTLERGKIRLGVDKLFYQVYKQRNFSFHQLKPPKSRAGWKTTKKGVQKHQIPPEKLNSKPVQEWWDWDGFGKYKFRHHKYPNNPTLRDVQRRRIFKIFAEERLRVNSIFRNEILPKVKSFYSNHLNTTQPKYRLYLFVLTPKMDSLTPKT